MNIYSLLHPTEQKRFDAWLRITRNRYAMKHGYLPTDINMFNTWVTWHVTNTTLGPCTKVTFCDEFEFNLTNYKLW